MPEGPRDRQDGPASRDAAARAADHAAIARLSDELVPALIAKLGATRLGEIEVREGEWRLRLRRPVARDGAEASRRSTDRPARGSVGHDGHGHGVSGGDAHARRSAVAAAGPALAAVGPGRGDGHANGHGPGGAEPERRVATSPAVGIFVPAPNLTSGQRVRAGDRLGIVDMLGVPQEVVAPVDGIVGATLVEAGTAVEYGQELVRIELGAAAEAS